MMKKANAWINSTPWLPVPRQERLYNISPPPPRHGERKTVSYVQATSTNGWTQSTHIPTPTLARTQPSHTWME
eukprot:365165-Chlamydomonas_euryale.AAC.7